MARYGYTPPEATNARKEAQGRQLTLFGAALVGLGGIGIILSSVLKAVWLGILGGPIGALSWLALLAKAYCPFDRERWPDLDGLSPAGALLPCPDRLGFVMKYSCALKASFASNPGARK